MYRQAEIWWESDKKFEFSQCFWNLSWTFDMNIERSELKLSFWAQKCPPPKKKKKKKKKSQQEIIWATKK